MKSSKIIDIFKDGNITIPLYLLKNFNSFNVEYNEFIFLMYLYNKGNNWIFNPEVINSDLGLDTVEIMSLISSLSDKGIITGEKFVTSGAVKGVEGVVKLYVVSASNGTGWSTTIGAKADGSFYDIGKALGK